MIQGRRGKLSPQELKKAVLKYAAKKGEEIMVPPGIGLDASAIKEKNQVLVLSTDPITGSKQDLGRLAVHVNANDVAVMGAVPKWLLVTLLFPPNSKLEEIGEVMRQIHENAEKINVKVIGGHTEVTAAVTQPTIVATAVGVTTTSKLTPSSNCKTGDYILMTKYAGIEGTAILARDYSKLLMNKVSPQTVEKAKNLIRYTSVLKEAGVLVHYSHALHDPTEGGVLNGLWEMAEASNVGLRVYEDKIRVLEETREICRALKLDPLKLISSGVVIASIPKNKIETVTEEFLSMNIPCSVIGEVLEKERGRKILRNNGWMEISPVQDELWKIVGKRGLS